MMFTASIAPWSQLRSASSYKEVRQAFARYCSIVLGETDEGRLSQQMAGCYIAQAMFIRSVEADVTCEAITQYAGELEFADDPAEQVRLRSLMGDLLQELD